VSFAYFVPSLSAIRLFIPISPIKSEEEGESTPQRFVCDVHGWPRYLKLIYEFSEKVKNSKNSNFQNFSKNQKFQKKIFFFKKSKISKITKN